MGLNGEIKKFNHVGSFPVQINPHKINIIQGSNKVYNAPGGITSGDTTHTYHIRYPEHDDDHKLTIELNYDIYDEYNVATMDGALNSHKYSLFNDELVSLQRLQDMAAKNKLKIANPISGAGDYPNCYVLFVWGQIEFFGEITKVDFDYTKFSRWGDPLAANGTVTISEYVFARGGDILKPLESGEIEITSIGKIKAEQKIQEATLLASKALRWRGVKWYEDR